MKTKIIFFTLILLFMISNTSFVTIKKVGIKEIEEEVLVLVNKYRNSLGLSNLKMNEIIRESARNHSKNMASGSVSFGHDGFEARGKEIGQKFKFSGMAENVAYNSQGAAKALDQWIHSSGHQRNMAGKYTQTGIGVAEKSNVYYFTQIFTN